jgi:hypothetical protein
MLSHVFLGVSDFERAFRWHAAVMAALGNTLRFPMTRAPGPAGSLRRVAARSS